MAKHSAVVERIRERLYARNRSIFNHLVEEEIASAREVLLFGAGRGVHERDWRTRGRRIVGVDVETAVRENKLLDEAYVYDGSFLPFKDGRFDLCVARWVIEHLPDPSLSFHEIGRVLRPGGRFVFLTSNRWFYAYVLASLIPNRWHPTVMRWGIGRSNVDTFPTYYRANSRIRVRKLLRDAGFEERFLTVELSGADYLEFSAPLYVLGVLYERIVNRFPLLMDLRQAIVGCFMRLRI